MRRVIVLGSANTDLTVKADRLPRPGETVVDGELMVSYGGKGANQAMAALKAGASVTFLARIGTDPFGERLHDHLVESGIPEEGLIRDPHTPAGVALISVDRDGNNQIVVASGSNRQMDTDDLQALGKHLAREGVFLTQLEIPIQTVEAALRMAKAGDMTTILNPAPSTPLSSDIFPFIDILTPNQYEAGQLSGLAVNTEDDAREAAHVLRTRGCGTVIITLGAQGALLNQGDRTVVVPSFSVKAIDSVGAGDAFNGALAAALARGQSLDEAVRFAAAAGALCTTKRGAQESLPSRHDIEALLRSG